MTTLTAYDTTVGSSIKTDEFVRDIFLNISNEDALNFLGKEGGVRTALLSCNNEHIKFH